MSFLKRKTINVWVGVNRNGSLSMHTEQPIKDEERGIWVSNKPFINSVIYNDLSNTIQKTNLSFESSPEFLKINI